MSFLPLCGSHSFTHLISRTTGAWVPCASVFPPQPHSSDTMLPGLGPICCLSSFSVEFKLVRSKVQQIQSSVGLLRYLFVPVTCQIFSGPTKTMRRSLALYRPGLTCASPNQGTPLEGEQRPGASKGSRNNFWSLLSYR